MRFRDPLRDINRYEQKLENVLLYVDFMVPFDEDQFEFCMGLRRYVPNHNGLYSPSVGYLSVEVLGYCMAEVFLVRGAPK